MREDGTLVIPFDRLTGMDLDILMGKARRRDGAGAPRGCDDFRGPGDDSQFRVRECVARLHVLFAIGKQFASLTRGLLVIISLSVRQWFARWKDVNPSVHVDMDQTGQFEIPGYWEDDGKGLPLKHFGCGNAGRAIEDCRVSRKTRAPDMKIGTDLGLGEKRHGMALVHIERPGDAVSGVDPRFHWAEKP